MIEYRYDRNNRLAETVDSMNHVTRTEYDNDGIVIVKINGRGNNITNYR